MTLSWGALQGCTSPPPRIPASGELAGQQIRATVDSDIAKYYLEYYLQGRRMSPLFDRMIDQVHRNTPQGLPTRLELRQLSERFSVDFATLLLAKRLLESPANRALQALFEQEKARVRRMLWSGGSLAVPDYANYRVLFVPAWDYQETGAVTGADFAVQQQLLAEIGLENRLVKVDPTGSVEGNARLIAQAILRQRKTGKHIVLVSASSAGPAVALALGACLAPDEADRVTGWLNIAGILQGTPIIDHYQQWPRRWLMKRFIAQKGWRQEHITSMSVQHSRARFRQLRLPERLTIVNYASIPLSGDISPYAMEGYLILRSQGPNDGVTLITDGMVPHAVTLVDLGTDHYINRAPDIQVKTLALARTFIKHLEAVRARH